jgi:hypothetical protein
MNEPRVPIHPQPSFNDVRRLQDQLIQACARLLPANEKLYEENIRLRKVVSILVSEGRKQDLRQAPGVGPERARPRR